MSTNVVSVSTQKSADSTFADALVVEIPLEIRLIDEVIAVTMCLQNWPKGLCAREHDGGGPKR